jgi:hypothetical protein
MGGTRGTGIQRFKFFMLIVTALWLIAAFAAVIDRDTLNAGAWFGFAAFGALSANGSAERSRGLAYLAIALLFVSIAILMGVFLAD